MSKRTNRKEKMVRNNVQSTIAMKNKWGSIKFRNTILLLIFTLIIRDVIVILFIQYLVSSTITN